MKTEINIENLKLLYDKLLNNEFKAELDMSCFADTRHNEYSKTCGSFGCLIGNMSYFIPKKVIEGWFDYSKRVFGLDRADNTWCYLFSSDWLVVKEGQREGALKRIEYVLKNKKAPDVWDYKIEYSSKLEVK